MLSKVYSPKTGCFVSIVATKGERWRRSPSQSAAAAEADASQAGGRRTGAEAFEDLEM